MSARHEHKVRNRQTPTPSAGGEVQDAVDRPRRPRRQEEQQ